MQAAHERGALLALHVDQPMRDVVFVEKVIELPAFARLDLGQNPQTGELLVALQPHPAHDERVHDRLSDLRHFGQRASQFRRGHL